MENVYLGRTLIGIVNVLYFENIVDFLPIILLESSFSILKTLIKLFRLIDQSSNWVYVNYI